MDNTTKWYNSNYDCYGNPLGYIQDDIQIGDTVEYAYADNHMSDESGRPKSKRVTVKVQGVWDGEKACFNDKKNVVVRAKAWLKLVK